MPGYYRSPSMVARSALSRSVVKVFDAEDIPHGLLWHSRPAAWNLSSAEAQQRLEQDVRAWLALDL